MTDFFAPNPLTMLHDELWRILDLRSEIGVLIKEGNRIKFNYVDDRDPFKQNASTYDFPELVLAPETLSGNLSSSSSSTSIDVIYVLRTSTGDYRYNQFLAQVQWMLLGTMVNWRDTIGAITWQGKPFIKSVNIDSNIMGFTEVDLQGENIRKRGWSDLMRFNIKMMFTTSDVALELANTI